MSEHIHARTGPGYVAGCGGCQELSRAYRSRDDLRAKKALYRAQRHRERREERWRDQGINPAEAAAALSAHDGLCDMCGVSVPGGNGGWHVDHDHRTGAVRGILCVRHNLGLGLFRDSPVELQQAIEYLNRQRES